MTNVFKSVCILGFSSLTPILTVFSQASRRFVPLVEPKAQFFPHKRKDFSYQSYDYFGVDDIFIQGIIPYLFHTGKVLTVNVSFECLRGILVRECSIESWFGYFGRNLIEVKYP